MPRQTQRVQNTAEITRRLTRRITRRITRGITRGITLGITRRITVDDAVSRAYQAWPDRLVLVDQAGRVSYQGAPGPYGFEPDELEAAIQELLNL